MVAGAHKMRFTATKQGRTEAALAAAAGLRRQIKSLGYRIVGGEPLVTKETFKNQKWEVTVEASYLRK